MIWQPCPIDKTASNFVQSDSVKVKGKEKAQDTAIEQMQPLRVRSVWLRFHPCIHNEILEALKEAASQTLAEYKAQNPVAGELMIELIDRRRQFNTFEIMGPKSSQILKGVLRPVMPDKRNDFLNVRSPFSECPLIADMISSFGMASVVCKVQVQFHGEWL